MKHPKKISISVFARFHAFPVTQIGGMFGILYSFGDLIIDFRNGRRDGYSHGNHHYFVRKIGC